MKGMAALSELSKASKEAKEETVSSINANSINLSIENHPLLRKKDEEIRSLSRKVLELQSSLNQLIKSKNDEISRTKKKPLRPEQNITSEDSILILKNKQLQSIDSLKMLNAIKKETQLQKRDDIKLSRKNMVAIYKINESKVTITRNALENHGFIKVIEEQKNKYRYRVLKDLPSF